ncbi:MAG TPA: hypothetical protein VJN18_13020 [Polyangiaceae bacterium]|nr:hypothetical protein [Polyangiaceae bacterium]
MNVSSRWCVTAVFALATFGCSDPVPPPAKGAFIASVKPATSPPVGKACPTSAFTYDVPIVLEKMANPPEFLTENRYKRKIVDGESGASVSCAVKGRSTFTFSGEIQLGDRGLSFSNGTIGADKKGTAQVTVIKTGSPGFPTMMSPTANCTIDAAKADGNNYQIEAGHIWARFVCPSVENVPTDFCAADGFLVFENCDQ